MQRPEWMSEAVWRTLRTLWQAFWGVFVIALYSALIAYMEPPHVFNLAGVYYGGVVGGVAAVLAWFMNRKG